MVTGSAIIAIAGLGYMTVNVTGAARDGNLDWFNAITVPIGVVLFALVGAAIAATAALAWLAAETLLRHFLARHAVRLSASFLLYAVGAVGLGELLRRYVLLPGDFDITTWQITNTHNHGYWIMAVTLCVVTPPLLELWRRR